MTFSTGSRCVLAFFVTTFTVVGGTMLVHADGGDAPGDDHRVSVTINAPFLVFPVLGVMGEMRLGANQSISGHAAVGRVTIDLPFGDDNTNTIKEIGGLWRYYVSGGFQGGVTAGVDVRYIDAEDGKWSNVKQGVAFGPVVGYKKIFGMGLTLDILAGYQLAAGDVDGPGPFFHGGAGWSF